ncbi:conserved hypothetical protein [Ricinus communis]|uniref:Uncharacterized protein n=1 Tax=Ricinus communis TaxID=3988 RepID=B9SUA5_RICCO|nr:conserved hypothetical protein [Ricinus communis]
MAWTMLYKLTYQVYTIEYVPGIFIPLGYHRICAMDIYPSWAKKWRCEERKKAFWACAKSTYERQLK